MKYLFLYCIIVLVTAFKPGSVTGSAVSEADAKSALEFHNQVRQEVGVPPLEWSTELAAYAQQWADHLAAEDCAIEHRPRSGQWKQLYGENIFWGSGNMFDVSSACKSWYNEKKDYNGAAYKGNEDPVVGHYTQMVWKTTRKMGIGMARCSNGSIIIVANYDPPGNYLGQKPY